ncbi:hypothetical protein D043_3905A, partial [Vibrio parahaemolyticus EKP-021]
MSRKISP